jgi:hypothetical protein
MKEAEGVPVIRDGRTVEKRKRLFNRVGHLQVRGFATNLIEPRNLFDTVLHF